MLFYVIGLTGARFPSGVACNELPRGGAKSDIFSLQLSEFGGYGNVQHTDAIGMWSTIRHNVRC